MEREIINLSVRTLSLVTRCNATLVRLCFIAIIFFTCADAQSHKLARLIGHNKPISKDETYFWEQTRLHSMSQPEPVPYYYYGYNQGQFLPRDDKSYYYSSGYDYGNDDRNDYQTDYETTEETTPSETENPPSTTVQLQEVPAAGSSESNTGEEKPCAAGKECPKRGVSLREAEAMMIETVKRNVLSALKMKEPPNGTHPKLSLDSPPISHLIKRYNIKVDRNFEELESEFEPEYELDQTSKESVISYAREPLYPSQSGSYFKFDEDDLRYTVDSAIIWFYIKPNPTNRSNISLDFYRYQQNTTHPDADPVEVKFDRKVIRTQRKGHWKQMSIKHIVSKWFIHPESNLGIDIRCREIPGLVISGPTEQQQDKKPVLEIALSHNERSRRRKRNVNMICTDESNHPSCCRYKIPISFANMGWDWIISPQGYSTYYCNGDCPAHYLESNQNRMLGMAPQGLKPQGLKVCCTPTEMSSMTMLYWDNQNNVIYSKVPNMIVEKCGCM